MVLYNHSNFKICIPQWKQLCIIKFPQVTSSFGKFGKIAAWENNYPSIYYNNYLFLLLHRAWQRKLYQLVKNEEHRAELYACLWMLIAEQDSNKFLELHSLLISYWEDKEPQFLTYYKNEYSNRAGVHIHTCMHTINVYMFTEKWALCHRVFDHQDVDTNMLVERYTNAYGYLIYR